MGTGFSKRKKQAKMIQEQISKMQTELETAEFVGTSGAGLVTLTLGGDYHLKIIKIKPECVDPEDIQGLEDLIKAAHNDALQKIEAKSKMGMPSLGKGLPGLF